MAWGNKINQYVLYFAGWTSDYDPRKAPEDGTKWRSKVIFNYSYFAN